MSRRVIVVDVETTGLNPAVHVPTEVAAIDLATGDYVAHFAAALSADELFQADPESLAVNRHFERRVPAQALARETAVKAYKDLFKALDGATLAGSNPRFDSAMLLRGARLNAPSVEPWHHRLLDLSAYAAGVLSLPLGDMPGLDRVAELCGVKVDPAKRHTALGDAEVTAACFRHLMKVAADRTPDAVTPQPCPAGASATTPNEETK